MNASLPERIVRRSKALGEFEGREDQLGIAAEILADGKAAAPFLKKTRLDAGEIEAFNAPLIPLGRMYLLYKYGREAYKWWPQGDFTIPITAQSYDDYKNGVITSMAD